MPLRCACSWTGSCACFLVPTNRTDPPSSSSCFMVTTATGLSLGYDFRPLRPSSDGATLGCGRANSRTGARVTISVGGRPSRQPFGLDPIGPGEPHGEDEAAAAQADPHREAGWIDTPDDPARDP